VRKRFKLSGGAYKRYEPGPVFADHVEQFKENPDTWAWGRCPFHLDSNPSFSMNVQTGWYRCASTSCGTTGGNIVSFVCAIYELETRQALQYLEDHYG
jgi:DNA primase